MARFRVAIRTSAYPSTRVGGIVDADPADRAVQARVAAGVLVPVDVQPTVAVDDREWVDVEQDSVGLIDDLEGDG